MTITFDASAVIDKLTNMKKDISDNTNIALQESGMLLQEEIQASIEGQRAEPRSVDTGEFLASISINSFDGMVEVYSDVPQALFMEYGTTRIFERRHFRNSLSRTTPLIIDKVKEAVSNSIE